MRMLDILCKPELVKTVRERISFCNGIRIGNASPRADYPPMLPLDIWRPCPPDVLDSIITSSTVGRERGTYIGFLQATDAALGGIIDFLNWFFESPNTRCVADSRVWAKEHKLFDTLYDAGPNDDTLFFGLARNVPDTSCVTVDREVDTHVGLHIDNFDRLLIHERHSGRNRISVNVGTDKRFLLFVELQAVEVFNRVVEQLRPAPDDYDRLKTDQRELVWQYFHLFPEAPVYRLEIRPGEAYMAPTENFIHDGSTLGSRDPDWTAVWFGQLEFARFRNRELSVVAAPAHL